eukprot:gene15871-18861_t
MTGPSDVDAEVYGDALYIMSMRLDDPTIEKLRAAIDFDPLLGLGKSDDKKASSEMIAKSLMFVTKAFLHDIVDHVYIDGLLTRMMTLIKTKRVDDQTTFQFFYFLGVWSCKLIIYMPSDKLDGHLASLKTLKKENTKASSNTKQVLDKTISSLSHPRGAANLTELMRNAYLTDMFSLVSKFDRDVSGPEVFNERYKVTPAATERRKKLIREAPVETHRDLFDTLTKQSGMTGCYGRIVSTFGDQIDPDKAVKIAKAVSLKIPNDPIRHQIAHILLYRHLDTIDMRVRKEISDAAKETGTKYYSNDKFQEAVDYYSIALDIGGPIHTIFSNRSIALFRLGKYQEALDAGRQCITMQPDWPRGYQRVGVALEGLGRYQEAIEQLNKGLTYDSNNQELIKALDSVKEKIIDNFELDIAGDELLQSAMKNLKT